MNKRRLSIICFECNVPSSASTLKPFIEPFVKIEGHDVANITDENLGDMTEVLEGNETVIYDESHDITMTFTQFPKPFYATVDFELIKREDDAVSNDIPYFETVCIVFIELLCDFYPMKIIMPITQILAQILF